jgi:hypothetical protein
VVGTNPTPYHAINIELNATKAENITIGHELVRASGIEGRNPEEHDTCFTSCYDLALMSMWSSLPLGYG